MMRSGNYQMARMAWVVVIIGVVLVFLWRGRYEVVQRGSSGLVRYDRWTGAASVLEVRMVGDRYFEFWEDVPEDSLKYRIATNALTTYDEDLKIMEAQREGRR